MKWRTTRAGREIAVLILVGALAIMLLDYLTRPTVTLEQWCWDVRGEMSEGRCYAPCAPVPCYSPELIPGEPLPPWPMQ